MHKLYKWHINPLTDCNNVTTTALKEGHHSNLKNNETIEAAVEEPSQATTAPTVVIDYEAEEELATAEEEGHWHDTLT